MNAIKNSDLVMMQINKSSLHVNCKVCGSDDGGVKEIVQVWWGGVKEIWVHPIRRVKEIALSHFPKSLPLPLS